MFLLFMAIYYIGIVALVTYTKIILYNLMLDFYLLFIVISLKCCFILCNRTILYAAQF